MLAAFIQLAKEGRFEFQLFVARFFVSLVIVCVAAPALFLGWCFCAMATSAASIASAGDRMIFFGITLGIAALMVLIWRFVKRKPFALGAFIERVLWTWGIVMAAAIVLFLGWCFLALSSIHGPINQPRQASSAPSSSSLLSSRC